MIWIPMDVPRWLRRIRDPSRARDLGRASDVSPRDWGTAVAAGALLASLTVASTSCAGAAIGTAGPPVPARPAVASAMAEGGLERPSQIVFSWRLNEAGSRLQGRGAARMEPPYHARLDLFTENGETAARVALVDGDLRLPASVDLRLIPPPPLLWASLGVFHPGTEAELLGAEQWGEEGTRIRYGLPDARELRYGLVNGEIRAAELVREGQVVQSVLLEEEGDGGFPDRSTYRDLTAFRELRVTLESVERVNSFAPDIWEPGR